MAKEPSPTGTLVIIGGALKHDNEPIWTRIVRHAGEAKTHPVSADAAVAYRPKIAVFPTASGEPERSGQLTSDTLAKFGADPFIVPLMNRSADDRPHDVANDLAMAERVKQADGVYFTGGSQARITTALRTADGKDTPLLKAVWDVYRNGGCVAGSSAGAAIMSNIMYRDAKRVLGTMQNGVTMGKEVDQGLGFLDSGWFVEQHTLVRGRFARALVAMKTSDIKFGVGVDENTAVIVKNDDMEVVGTRGVIVMDMSEAKQDAEQKGFNLSNVKLTYLDDGDAMRLSTREVTPSSAKQTGNKFDWKSPDFKPEDDEKLYTEDILGNTVAVNMMCRMIRNRHGEARGLAFDGVARQQGPTTGFEFKFYRGDDTYGWSSSARGDETFTVRNVRLDIRPVELAGSLPVLPK